MRSKTGPSSQAAARTIQVDVTIVVAGGASEEPPQETAAARPTSGSLGIWACVTIRHARRELTVPSILAPCSFTVCWTATEALA